MTADGDTRGDQVTVIVPAELPVLTTRTCRILVEILRELSEVEALEEPTDGEFA